MENNLLIINVVITILFIFVYALLLHKLIAHMREMVRLKYHTYKRAEFDENRVKIIIGSVVLLWLAYVAVWIFCIFGLDLSKQDDQETSSALFKAMAGSMLIGAYALFFINNRIGRDIAIVKKLAGTQQDQSQELLKHL